MGPGDLVEERAPPGPIGHRIARRERRDQRVLDLGRIAREEPDPRARRGHDRREAHDVVLDDHVRRELVDDVLEPRLDVLRAVDQRPEGGCDELAELLDGGLAEHRCRVPDEVDPELPGDLGLCRRRPEAHQPLFEALGLEIARERLLDDEHHPVPARPEDVADADTVVGRAVGALGEEDDRPAVAHRSHLELPQVPKAAMIASHVGAGQNRCRGHPAGRRRPVGPDQTGRVAIAATARLVHPRMIPAWEGAPEDPRNMTLAIDGLRKRFGAVQALDGVSFDVPSGQVFGFLGANGAGKTTTMRIVLGLLRADEGTVTLDGRATHDLPRRTWGYLPEERGLYLRMPVIDQLVYFAKLYGVPRAKARADALGWLARFRIAEYADRRAETLSKGNQQKVQFIATILHDPDVLLMDEPFSGLDPVNVALLKSAFLELRDRGKALLFSTHQLEQAEELCDSVAIIDKGRIVTSGPTREVKRSTGHQVVRVAVAGDGDGAWLRDLPHVTVTRPGRDYTEVLVDTGANPQIVLQAALARGGDILRFEVGDPSLEEVFVERVGAVDTTEQNLASVEEVQA